MNLANISQFIVGIYPYQDYNETVYCLENAVRNNELKRCMNISGFYIFEYFPLFVFQASVPCQIKTSFYMKTTIVQGLNTTTVQVNAVEFGGDLVNGTYTDAMAELQNRKFDTIMTYVGQTASM